MGMFKQMKDMKGMIHDAPGQIAAAQETAKNAQAMAAAYQAQAAQQMAAVSTPSAPEAVATGPDFDPVGGVSLEMYVDISKGIAASNNDPAQGPLLAAARGIDPGAWETATATWNARMGTNPAVGQRFSALYRQA